MAVSSSRVAGDWITMEIQWISGELGTLELITRKHHRATTLLDWAQRVSDGVGTPSPPHQHSQACQLQQQSILPFVAKKHLFIRFLACIRKCLNWIIRNRLRFIYEQLIRWCERNECPNKLFNPLKITCYIICTCISEIINCFGWNYCQIRWNNSLNRIWMKRMV